MRSVVAAPCSPFSVTPDLMRATAAQARELGVLMHTHVAETRDEEEFCLENFGMRPVEYMEDLSWVGADVWFAHAVHVADDEVRRLSESATGVAHCPTSNMRLASGLAPVGRFIESGARVGLGVDGSASNDSADMIGEVRQTLLLNRLAQSLEGQEAGLVSARDVLELATIGGASLLGRDDLGRLAPGYAADLIAVDLDRVELAGALHDPVAAMVFCSSGRIDHSWVAGQRLVDGGRVIGVDQPKLVEEHNRLSLGLTD